MKQSKAYMKARTNRQYEMIKYKINYANRSTPNPELEEAQKLTQCQYQFDKTEKLPKLSNDRYEELGQYLKRELKKLKKADKFQERVEIFEDNCDFFVNCKPYYENIHRVMKESQTPQTKKLDPKYRKRVMKSLKKIELDSELTEEQREKKRLYYNRRKEFHFQKDQVKKYDNLALNLDQNKKAKSFKKKLKIIKQLNNDIKTIQIPRYKHYNYFERSKPRQSILQKNLIKKIHLNNTKYSPYNVKSYTRDNLFYLQLAEEFQKGNLVDKDYTNSNISQLNKVLGKKDSNAEYDLILKNMLNREYLKQNGLLSEQQHLKVFNERSDQINIILQNSLQKHHKKNLGNFQLQDHNKAREFLNRMQSMQNTKQSKKQKKKSKKIDKTKQVIHFDNIGSFKQELDQISAYEICKNDLLEKINWNALKRKKERLKIYKPKQLFKLQKQKRAEQLKQNRSPKLKKMHIQIDYSAGYLEKIMSKSIKTGNRTYRGKLTKLERQQKKFNMMVFNKQSQQDIQQSAYLLTEDKNELNKKYQKWQKKERRLFKRSEIRKRRKEKKSKKLKQFKKSQKSVTFK